MIRRLQVDGIDTELPRELDETSDEPWCYRHPTRRRRG